MRVTVLGAGIVGAATAYYLTGDGHDVTVVDKGDAPASGCSRANAGLVNGYTAVPWSAPGIPKTVLKEFWRDAAPYRVRLRADLAMAVWIARFFGNCTKARTATIKERLRRLSSYSFDMLKALRDSERIDYDSQSNGLLYLYRDDASLQTAFRTATGGDDPRAFPTRLTLGETLEREPALRGTRCHYAGALHYEHDESGDARLFAEGLIRAAIARGAQPLYCRNVSAIQVERGRVHAVTTDAGDLRADAVVVATGIGSAPLLAPFGINLPMYPVKGYSATIDAADPSTLPRHALQDVARKITMTPLGTRLRAAGTAELAGNDPAINCRRAESLHNHMQAMLPAAAADTLPSYWAGLRPMTPDSLPLIGATTVEGLWLNTGHGSLGWTMACGSGRIVADLVAGKPPAISLDGLGLR